VTPTYGKLIQKLHCTMQKRYFFKLQTLHIQVKAL
jgi:hypothetical protein